MHRAPVVAVFNCNDDVACAHGGTNVARAKEITTRGDQLLDLAGNVAVRFLEGLCGGVPPL